MTPIDPVVNVGFVTVSVIEPVTDAVLPNVNRFDAPDTVPNVTPEPVAKFVPVNCIVLPAPFD